MRVRPIVLVLSALAAGSGRADGGAPGPGDGPTIEAARRQLWSGDLAGAERSFSAILRRHPRSVDALVGLAQARRWSGRPRSAGALAARALGLDPSRADAREELAWALLDAGRPSRAARTFDRGSAAPSPPLAERVRLAGRPSLSLAGVGYSDSNGVVRVAPRVGLGFHLGGDVRLRFAGGLARVTAAGEGVDLALAGVTLSVPLGPFELGGGWAVHRIPGETVQEGPWPLPQQDGSATFVHEGRISVGAAASDALTLGIEARRRPVLEPESLATDERAYHAAGPGGTLDPVAVARRGVDELRFSVQAAPLRSAYLYAEGRAFELTDANRGWSAAAGAGVNLLALLGAKGPVSLTARWDAYFTGFEAESPEYYSPPLVDGHAPGVELRARLGRHLEIAGEGGLTFSLTTDPGARGAFAGGAVALRSGRWELAARGQLRNDPWYASRRALLTLATRL
jgi:hypothetical protein